MQNAPVAIRSGVGYEQYDGFAILFDKGSLSEFGERQKKTKDELQEMVGVLSAHVSYCYELLISSHLQLPDTVQIAFLHTNDGTLAEALPDMTIAYADETVGLLGLSATRHSYQYPKVVFDGITAHELSHLSDYAAHNYDYNNPSPSDMLITEGKAEHVAYWHAQSAYDQVSYSKSNLEGCSANELTNEVIAFVETPKIKNRQQENKIYEIGYHVVQRALEVTGSDIFALHKRPTEFFIKQYLNSVEA